MTVETERALRSLVVAALAAVFLPTACSPPHEAGAPLSGQTFEVVEEEGIPVARSSSGPLYDGPLFAVEPFLTLHQDPDNRESILYEPRGVRVGPQGHYFVLDTGNSRVAVFDETGEFVRAFGRAGQGPGELSDMAVLQTLNHGVLSVFDSRQQRATLFGTDGAMLDELSNDGFPVSSLELGPEGRLIKIGGTVDEGTPPGFDARRVQVFSREGGEPIAEVRTSSVKAATVEFFEMDDGATAARVTRIPYSGQPSAVHVPGRGFLLSDGDKPMLTWYDYDGRPTRIIRVELPVRPVTPAMRARYDEGRRRRLREAAERDGRDPPRVPDSEFPDEVGFWQRVVVDDYGYVWLEDVLTATERAEGDPWKFLLLDPEGRFLGTVDLPMARPTISGGYAMGTVVDPETGETEVRVYRLRPLPEGFTYPTGAGADPGRGAGAGGGHTSETR